MLRSPNMNTPLAVIESRLRTQTRTKLAAELGVSEAYLRDVIKGRRPASSRLIGALGLERIVTYRRKRNG